MDKIATKAKVKQFFSKYELRTYKKGELILQPEKSSGVFFLLEGQVREYAISPQGIEVGVHIFFPESYFPMMWVVADIPNRYYYEALTDVKIYNAPKDTVFAFLKGNADVLLELTKRIFIGLDKLTARIEYLSYGKASQKIISILLYLARHYGEEKNGKTVIKQKFTHLDIGALAGVTRETTSRELKKLEDKKIITYSNNSITFNNLEKLSSEL